MMVQDVNLTFWTTLGTNKEREPRFRGELQLLRSDLFRSHWYGPRTNFSRPNLRSSFYYLYLPTPPSSFFSPTIQPQACKRSCRHLSAQILCITSQIRNDAAMARFPAQKNLQCATRGVRKANFEILRESGWRICGIGATSRV